MDLPFHEDIEKNGVYAKVRQRCTYTPPTFLQFKFHVIFESIVINQTQNQTPELILTNKPGNSFNQWKQFRITENSIRNHGDGNNYLLHQPKVWLYYTT